MRGNLAWRFENVGGQWTVVVFGVHWGNRVVGLTIFNLVIELEY